MLIPVSKWRRGRGILWSYQKAPGSGGGNQGATGYKSRWYPLRALRQRMGKHSLGKLMADNREKGYVYV